MTQSHTNTYRIYTRSHKVKVDFKDFSATGHIRVGILVYKLKGIVRKPKFSDQFKTIQKMMDTTGISCDSLYVWL